MLGSGVSLKRVAKVRSSMGIFKSESTSTSGALAMDVFKSKVTGGGGVLVTVGLGAGFPFTDVGCRKAVSRQNCNRFAVDRDAVSSCGRDLQEEARCSATTFA